MAHGVMQRWLCLAGVAALWTGAARGADADYAAVIAPNNGLKMYVVKERAGRFSLSAAAFNADGSRVNAPEGKPPAAPPMVASGPFTIDGDASHNVTLGCAVVPGDGAVKLSYSISSGRDISLGVLALSINPVGDAVSQIAVLANGKEMLLAMPLQRGSDIRNVSRVTLRTKNEGEVVMSVDPPVTVSSAGVGDAADTGGGEYSSGTADC